MAHFFWEGRGSRRLHKNPQHPSPQKETKNPTKHKPAPLKYMLFYLEKNISEECVYLFYLYQGS